MSDGEQEINVAVKKTALGVQVMKDRSVSLSGQQRSALILVDGKRDAAEIVRMTAAIGVSLSDIDTLIAQGLVEMDATAGNHPQTSAAMNMPSSMESPVASSSQNSIDFQAALNAAITMCSDLGFKGFSLNLALTGVDSLEKLQKMAPEIRKTAGDKKYALLHPYIFGKSL